MENNIELRSEKVRMLLGKIPSRFLRYGSMIIAISFVVMIVIVNIIEIPVYDKYPLIIDFTPKVKKFIAPTNSYVTFKKVSTCTFEGDTICAIVSQTNSDSVYFVIAPFTGYIEPYVKNNGKVEKNKPFLAIFPINPEKLLFKTRVPIAKIVDFQQNIDVIVELSDKNKTQLNGTVAYQEPQGSDLYLFLYINNYNKIKSWNSSNTQGKVLLLRSKQSLFKSIISK